MSNYNGRRGPNVSQYLRDLNAINRQETSNDEPFNMEEDLALFTNTQFFDFETGQNTDYQAHPVKTDMEAPPSTSPSDGMTPAPSVVGDLSNFDFIQGEFYRLRFVSRFNSRRFGGNCRGRGVRGCQAGGESEAQRASSGHHFSPRLAEILSFQYFCN